ncbi:MAG: PAS domain-containing protein [bacterium]
MSASVDELRAVLSAYELVSRASWPDLNPRLPNRAPHWGSATAETLQAELAAYVREVSPPRSNVRVFWKTGPAFTFAGCNDAFAADAGMKSPAEMIGIDDFDKRLPWRHQAAKYRRDDQAVVKSGEKQLDIVERQQSTDGSITWVRAGKAPIKLPSGEVIGVLGMYELLDAATGRALFMKNARPEKEPSV